MVHTKFMKGNDIYTINFQACEKERVIVLVFMRNDLQHTVDLLCNGAKRELLNCLCSTIGKKIEKLLIFCVMKFTLFKFLAKKKLLKLICIEKSKD